MDEHKHECSCGHGHHHMDEATQDLVAENDLLLSALIELLIEKKVFTEQEFQDKIDALAQMIEEEPEVQEEG